MTSKEAIQSVKDYVLAGNKNLQVLDTLLNNVATCAVAEIPPVAPSEPSQSETEEN